MERRMNLKEMRKICREFAEVQDRSKWDRSDLDSLYEWLSEHVTRYIHVFNPENIEKLLDVVHASQMLSKHLEILYGGSFGSEYSTTSELNKSLIIALEKLEDI